MSKDEYFREEKEVRIEFRMEKVFRKSQGDQLYSEEGRRSKEIVNDRENIEQSISRNKV